jgi:hypothetical protein
MSYEGDQAGTFRPLRKLFKPRSLLILAGAYIVLVGFLVAVGVQAIELWGDDGSSYCRELGWKWVAVEQRCVGP